MTSQEFTQRATYRVQRYLREKRLPEAHFWNEQLSQRKKLQQKIDKHHQRNATTNQQTHEIIF